MKVDNRSWHLILNWTVSEQSYQWNWFKFNPFKVFSLIWMNDVIYVIFIIKLCEKSLFCPYFPLFGVSTQTYRENMTRKISIFGHFLPTVNIPLREYFSGPYFPVFGVNTGKYRPEKTPQLDTFHAASVFILNTGKYGI